MIPQLKVSFSVIFKLEIYMRVQMNVVTAYVNALSEVFYFYKLMITCRRSKSGAVAKSGINANIDINLMKYIKD